MKLSASAYSNANGILLLELCLCLSLIAISLPTLLSLWTDTIKTLTQISQHCIETSEYHMIITTLESEFRYANTFIFNTQATVRALHSDGSALSLTFSQGALKLKKGNATPVTLNTQWHLFKVEFISISPTQIKLIFWPTPARATHIYCLTCLSPNGYILPLCLLLIAGLTLTLSTTSFLLTHHILEKNLLYFHLKTLYLAQSGWPLAQAHWAEIPVLTEPVSKRILVSQVNQLYHAPIPLDGDLYLAKSNTTLYSLGISHNKKYRTLLKYIYRLNISQLPHLEKVERS